MIRLALLALLLSHTVVAQKNIQVDVCVYGGTSAGIIAAYTAKKLNRSVILIEPNEHLGGLTTGGLGYTDIGNKYAVTGLGLDFYRQVGKHYGKFESWIFEPHVAGYVFKQYIDAAKLDIRTNRKLLKVKKQGAAIQALSFNDLTVTARMFIDATYEGDLLAAAGVSYTIGREANNVYNETYNGVQLREKHQFPDGIDPYKIPGKPESGLLWGISAEPLAQQGSGDKKVQAYNFRICLTEDPANSIPVSKPADYDSSKYELLLRVLEKRPAGDLHAFLKIDRMPNKKTDINNNGAFSTDMIGMNYDYPEADWSTRRQIAKAHELYIKGLLYFIGNDPRMPEHLRTQMRKFGYPKDEYTGTGNWSPQMYVREARRMIGAYVMTQANCEGKERVTDGVGMAAYTMDSHNCQRIVKDGMVKNEGDVQVGGFGPYPVSYRSLIPKAGECTNLLVPVCLSASHIAYGSIRMEPVFMVLGQAAATAASVSIDNNSSVQDVNVQKVQQLLQTNPLADGSQPDILIDNADTARVTITGNWTLKERTGFGSNALTADAPSAEPGSVRFTPNIDKAGRYTVYAYFNTGYKNLASQTSITVFDGQKETSVRISKSNIQVQGQTSGEWVKLGQFNLKAGANITIHAGNADGAVVADAVLITSKY